jgi:hypothetical protein
VNKGAYQSNRAEVSHQPLRRRERKLQSFTSPGSAQCSVSMRAATCNTFNLQRHLISRRTLRTFQVQAMVDWPIGFAELYEFRQVSRQNVRKLQLVVSEGPAGVITSSGLPRNLMEPPSLGDLPK